MGVACWEVIRYHIKNPYHFSFQRYMKCVFGVHPVLNAPELGVDDFQDEVSYKLHLNVLKAESQQVKPNQGIIIELMNLIFKQRRVEIESEPHCAEEILEKVATLRDYDHICYSVLSVQQGCFSTTFRALFFSSFLLGRDYKLVLVLISKSPEGY